MIQQHLEQVRRVPVSGLCRIGRRTFVVKAGGFRYELRFTPSARIELLSVHRMH
jgi:hypothetical protein